MAVSSHETIVAISSAVGAAARMIVRTSGSNSFSLARTFIESLPTDPGVSRQTLRLRGMDVPTTIYRFVSPRSYTGEEMVEFHLPGNPLLARMLLEDLVSRGARGAEPGEFSARAYFNGRIELAAAEGVAATIAAQNESELRAARQLMAGELTRRLAGPMESLATTLSLVEAGIDFSEEDVTFIAADDVRRTVEHIDAQLAILQSESARFEQLTHEPTIVLAGRPNAGKSTLLNALAGEHRAVVSDVAGTTRNTLSAHIALQRGIVRLVDVAGIDETPTDGIIDRQMTGRARREMEAADFIVLVRDASDERPAIDLTRPPDLIVLTKGDLVDAPAGTDDNLLVSARTGHHLAELRERLDVLAFGASGQSASLALNARHRAAVEEARKLLGRVLKHLTGSPELLALDLRESLDALGQIRGEITPDDVLGRVFSTFCIGK